MTWGIRRKVFFVSSHSVCPLPPPPPKRNKRWGGKCVPECFLKIPLGCGITLESVGMGAGQDAEGTKTSTPHIPGLGPSSVAQVTNRQQ